MTTSTQQAYNLTTVTRDIINNKPWFEAWAPKYAIGFVKRTCSFCLPFLSLLLVLYNLIKEGAPEAKKEAKGKKRQTDYVASTWLPRKPPRHSHTKPLK